MLKEFAQELTKFQGSNRPPRAMSPVGGEIVGGRLMRRLGIGAPAEFKVVSVEEAEKPTYSQYTWIAKSPDAEGRLRFGFYRDAPYVLLIRKIEQAISLLSLRCQYGIQGHNIGIPLLGNISECCVVQELLNGHQKGLAYEFFGGFKLPENTEKIRAAIAWDSPALLKLIAARLFLATTSIHGGNVLIDKNARLYSIDHEQIHLTDGKEVRKLATVYPSGRVWLAAQDVAALSPADIENLFDDLPAVSWPLGDKAATVSYYQSRLVTWQESFR